MEQKARYFFANNTNGKIKVGIIHDTFKLKSFFFRVKERQAYYIGQMWSITFIARAAATTLVRLLEIC